MIRDGVHVFDGGDGDRELVIKPVHGGARKEVRMILLSGGIERDFYLAADDIEEMYAALREAASQSVTAEETAHGEVFREATDRADRLRQMEGRLGFIGQERDYAPGGQYYPYITDMSHPSLKNAYPAWMLDALRVNPAAEDSRVPGGRE